MRRLLLLGLLLWPALAGAVDVGAANDLFWKGQHGEAAQDYRGLTANHPQSADLWYNLGCAEARAGRLGRAIHAFEQALILRPGDDDASQNLDAVRALALERGVAGAGDARVIPPGEDDTGTGLLTAMSAELLTFVFAGTWIALFALLIVWRRATRPSLHTTASFVALIMGLLAAASGGVLLGRAYVVENVQQGVVLARTSVRAGPGSEYARGVVLAEGVMVRLRGSDGDWRQVTLPDGAEGWLPTADVGVLERP